MFTPQSVREVCLYKNEKVRLPTNSLFSPLHLRFYSEGSEREQVRTGYGPGTERVGSGFGADVNA